MSKMLQATCAGMTVTCEGVPVPAATILSEGIGPSVGVLVLDEDRATYIAKTSPDLNATLGKIVSVLGDIAQALTLIDAKPPGTLPPAPVAAAQVVQIAAAAVELTLIKETLK